MLKIKTALVAASLVAIAAAAHAQGVSDLESGFHGNTPTVQSYTLAPSAKYSQHVRGAYAHSVAGQHDANPLIDNFHGNTER